MIKLNLLAAFFLIVIGVISLAYQGLTYTTEKKILDLGSLQATRKETHTIPLPPVVGAITLIGGVSLLVINARNNSKTR